MPEIDVTEVLLDSVVAGTRFDVIRRRQVIGNNGLVTLVENRIPNVIGSVTPTGDESLIREEAYSAQHKSVMVVTPFRLRSASSDTVGQNWQPDLIFWRDDYFIVRTVDDFSQFGIGMIQAECETFEYVPPPPRILTSVVGRLDFRLAANAAMGGGM